MPALALLARNSKVFLYLRLSLVHVHSWASITPMHVKAAVFSCLSKGKNMSAVLSVVQTVKGS